MTIELNTLVLYTGPTIAGKCKQAVNNTILISLWKSYGSLDKTQISVESCNGVKYFVLEQLRHKTVERNILAVKATAVLHNVGLAYNPEMMLEEIAQVEADVAAHPRPIREPPGPADRLQENFIRRNEVIQTFYRG
jgi:hypothetical protein